MVCILVILVKTVKFTDRSFSTRSQCARYFSVMNSLQARSDETFPVDDFRIKEVPLPEAILRVRIKCEIYDTFCQLVRADFVIKNYHSIGIDNGIDYSNCIVFTTDNEYD